MNDLKFSEWFCLKDGRKNFLIDPTRDRDVLFGQPEWEKEIDDRLRKSQLLEMPTRLVWWGQYGIGKTHRLHHMQFLINKNDYAYHVCYLKASDVQEKTGFASLHYELVNSLGQEKMRDLVKQYFKKADAGQVAPFSEICNGVSDVKDALEALGGPGKDPASFAWIFLCGQSLSKSEMQLAGLSRSKLERSADFAAVIKVFADIIESETGKTLLYLIDEFETTQRITNKTAEAQWNEAIRSILDLTNLSVVMTLGAEKSDELPILILRPDIVRRIQRDNYVGMEAFKAPETGKFIRDLLEKWVDDGKRSALEASEKFTGTVPDYKSELYPFTEEGFRRFCDQVTLDPRNSKPSEILAKLNNVAAEACLQKRRLIDGNHLTELGYA